MSIIFKLIAQQATAPTPTTSKATEVVKEATTAAKEASWLPQGGASTPAQLLQGATETINGELWGLVLLIALAWVIRLLIHSATRRYGVSSVWTNRLTALASATLFLVAISIYRPFEALRPMGLGPLVPIGLFVLLLVLFRDLVQDFVAAFSISLRGHISPGVQIKVADKEGIVERVGWGSVTVLSADGTRQIMPASIFARQDFAVRQPDKITRMSFSADLERPLSEAELKHIQHLSVLCPYRAPSSSIEVNVSPQGSRHTLHVRFQTPSEAASSCARAYLEHHLKQRRTS